MRRISHFALRLSLVRTVAIEPSVANLHTRQEEFRKSKAYRAEDRLLGMRRSDCYLPILRLPSHQSAVTTHFFGTRTARWFESSSACANCGEFSGILCVQRLNRHSLQKCSVVGRRHQHRRRTQAELRRPNCSRFAMIQAHRNGQVSKNSVGLERLRTPIRGFSIAARWMWVRVWNIVETQNRLLPRD